MRYARWLCYVDVFSASFLFEPPEEGRGVGFPRKLAILADCTTIDVLVSSGVRCGSFYMFPGPRQIPENLDLKTGIYNSNVSIEYTTNTAAHPATANICIIHCRCILNKKWVFTKKPFLNASAVYDADFCSRLTQESHVTDRM